MVSLVSQVIEHNSKLHEWISPICSSYVFWCPGCKENHVFTVYKNETNKGWKFDGNYNKPTFTPSLLYPEKSIRCHLFLSNGQIHYCGDCGHNLSGKVVDMVDIYYDSN